MEKPGGRRGAGIDPEREAEIFYILPSIVKYEKKRYSELSSVI